MKRQKAKYTLFLLDWLIVQAAYVLALEIRASHPFDLVSGDFPYLHREVLFFLGYSWVIMLIFGLNQLYKINVYLGITRQLQYLAQSLFYSAIGIALLSFFTKSAVIEDSRLVMIYFLLASFTMLAVARVIVFRTVFNFFAAHEIYPRTLLILGAGSRGMRLAEILSDRNEYHLHLVGFLDDVKPRGSTVLADVPVLGTPDDVLKVARRHRVQEILLCLEGVSDERFLEILDLCSKTRALVMVGSDQFGVLPRRLNLESYGEVPVFGLLNGKPALREPALKKLLDPVAAFLAIVVLSPLFLFVALAIKIDSRGPVLFRQTRVGKDGRPFTFYKFRSMRLGSDQGDDRREKLRRFIGENTPAHESCTKIVDESKVTRFGRFIRKTSIDELPQLINVLKGDMSLVGPRPCLPYEWENYAGWHKRRLSVIPGCTGLWQVFGRSEVGFRDMVILDLFYAYNVSFHLDVWLMLKTIPVMIFGSGGK